MATSGMCSSFSELDDLTSVRRYPSFCFSSTSIATKVSSAMNGASKTAGAPASSASCVAATRPAPAWCGRSISTPPGYRARASSPPWRPWSNRSWSTLSGWSSSASGSCTSHHSFLWHWRPDVKRDLERRYGTVVKVAQPTPPKLGREHSPPTSSPFESPHPLISRPLGSPHPLTQDQAFGFKFQPALFLTPCPSPVRWSSTLSLSRALVLTPCPPLPAGEGERGAISERPAQQRCQVIACHIAVRNADHAIARSLEGCRARGVVRPSFTPRVRRALKLEHQPLGGAVKVNDEPMQHVFAPKLEAEDAPLPQQRPCISLSGRCRASQLARLRKLPAGRDTPEWIHKSHARAASSDHQTETPRQRACCCGMRMCSREVAQGSPSPEGSPHPPDPLSLRERGSLRYLCSGDILHRNSRRQVDREPERDKQDAARVVANDGGDGGGRAGRRALSPRAGPRGDRPGRTTAAGSRGAVPGADRRHSDTGSAARQERDLVRWSRRQRGGAARL